MTCVKVSVGEFEQTRCEVRLFGARGGAVPDCFIQDLDGGIVGSTFVEHFAESVSGSGNGGMPGRQLVTVHLQALANESLRFREFGLIHAKEAERNQTFGNHRMLRAEDGPAAFECAVQQGIRAIERA